MKKFISIFSIFLILLLSLTVVHKSEGSFTDIISDIISDAIQNVIQQVVQQATQILQNPVRHANLDLQRWVDTNNLDVNLDKAKTLLIYNDDTYIESYGLKTFKKCLETSFASECLSQGFTNQIVSQGASTENYVSMKSEEIAKRRDELAQAISSGKEDKSNPYELNPDKLKAEYNVLTSAGKSYGFIPAPDAQNNASYLPDAKLSPYYNYMVEKQILRESAVKGMIEQSNDIYKKALEIKKQIDDICKQKTKVSKVESQKYSGDSFIQPILNALHEEGNKTREQLAENTNALIAEDKLNFCNLANLYFVNIQTLRNISVSSIANLYANYSVLQNQEMSVAKEREEEVKTQQLLKVKNY